MSYRYECDDCGETAFILTRAIVHGQIIMPQDVIYPDGSQPKLGDVLKCGVCGVGLKPYVDNVRPLHG